MMGLHKPSVGVIVFYHEGDHEAGVSGLGTNGTRFHPAVITRVWPDKTVNLTVFFDEKAPSGRVAVALLPDDVFAKGMHCSGSGYRFSIP